MKKMLSIAAFLMGMLNLSAQDKKEEITGNGITETKNVSVQPFTSLQSSGLFELKLTQGGSESVKLEGDQNLLPYISVRNEGNKLIIDMDKLKEKNVNLKTKNKLKVYVSFKNLQEMELKMIGNVNGSGNLAFENVAIRNKSIGELNLQLTANKFSLHNKGVGNVKLQGKAEDADISNKGVGALEAGNFAVKTINLENTGVGSVEVNATKEIQVKSSGIGSVKNKGAAPMPKKQKTVNI